MQKDFTTLNISWKFSLSLLLRKEGCEGLGAGGGGGRGGNTVRQVVIRCSTDDGSNYAGICDSQL